MAIRSVGSTSISFGLVSVPVRIYTAATSHDVTFNTLHSTCGGRVSQNLHCAVCDASVKDETVKGYEISKGHYVRFTGSELQSLKPSKFEHLAMERFVPLAAIDPILFEKSYFVGPDKGGARAFNLLTKAMRSTETVGLGRYMMRGKVYLALIRPFDKGLMLHHIYYADEVRSYADIEIGDDFLFSPEEEKLATQLVKSLSGDFDHNAFVDEYQQNVLKAADDKAAGKAVVLAPQVPPSEQVVDLFAALKQSLEAEKKTKSKTRKKKAG